MDIGILIVISVIFIIIAGTIFNERNNIGKIKDDYMINYKPKGDTKQIADGFRRKINALSLTG